MSQKEQNKETLNKALKLIAEKQAKEFLEIQREAEGYFDELKTQQNTIGNTIAIKGFDYLITKAYGQKIDVNLKEIRQLMKLMREHSAPHVQVKAAGGIRDFDALLAVAHMSACAKDVVYIPSHN